VSPANDANESADPLGGDGGEAPASLWEVSEGDIVTRQYLPLTNNRACTNSPSVHRHKVSQTDYSSEEDY